MLIIKDTLTPRSKAESMLRHPCRPSNNEALFSRFADFATADSKNRHSFDVITAHSGIATVYMMKTTTPMPVTDFM